MNDEETGEWLDFIFSEGRSRVPARISRAALISHFGARADDDSLVAVYVLHADAIHQRVKEKLLTSEKAVAGNTVTLSVDDFGPA